MKSTIMIAATRSNAGKTTFTTGFLNALKNKYPDKQSVHAFKCGPDYIDPMFHKSVLSINSTNLDSFFLDEEGLRKVFYENSGDINVIEAAMGLYDGIGVSKRASAYEVAASLNIKIILLVDASGIGYSLIPLLKGFIGEDDKKLIAGIVLNKISEKFYKKIAPAIEDELSLKVFGYVPVIKDAVLKSRHLGLISPNEADFENKLSLITQKLSESVDIEGIIKIGEAPNDYYYKFKSVTGINSTYKSFSHSDTGNILPLSGKKIIVSKDEAFSFIYEENIKLLKSLGANVSYFSPLHDSSVSDDADVIILYGGYPENYADELSDNLSMKQSIRDASRRGVKIIAECGGFMYLTDSITVDEKSYEMTGLIKGYSKRQNSLVRFGYVNVKKDDGISMVRAHEFHHFDTFGVSYSDEYLIENESSKETYPGIYKSDNIFAGFPHLYYLSNPEFIISIINGGHHE